MLRDRLLNGISGRFNKWGWGIDIDNPSGQASNDRFDFSNGWFDSGTNFFTISLWVRLDVFRGVDHRIIYGPDITSNIRLTWDNPNKYFSFVAYSAADYPQCNVTSGSFQPDAGSAWYHIYIARNSTSALYMYVDGVDRSFSVGNSFSDGVDFNTGPVYFGLNENLGVNPGSGYGGCVAEVWMDDAYWAPGTYLSKFRDSNNYALDLGSAGQLPTGSSPQVYLSNGSTDSASDFGTNKGTSGLSFNTIQGTVTTASNSPAEDW